MLIYFSCFYISSWYLSFKCILCGLSPQHVLCYLCVTCTLSSALHSRLCVPDDLHCCWWQFTAPPGCTAPVTEGWGTCRFLVGRPRCALTPAHKLPWALSFFLNCC